MNPLARHPSSNYSKTSCGKFLTPGERELSAFIKAVSQIFGVEQAQISAEDWLAQLVEINELPASTREWRLITAKASMQLANRVSNSLPATEPQLAQEKNICAFL
jgi:hypothetical protein